METIIAGSDDIYDNQFKGRVRKMSASFWYKNVINIFMKLRMIISIGIPASGKSTWANGMVGTGLWVKTGRDDFRYMLENKGICNGNIENLITKCQDYLILEALKSGHNVIIDNTNINLKYIEHWLNLVKGIPIEIYTLKFDISLEQAIARDKLRSRPVGARVITSMHRNLQNLDISNLNLKEWQL